LPSLLILQLKRIGDAVLTAPTLGALRAAWPEARITLVLAGAAGDLGPLFCGADEILIWEAGGLNLPLLKRVEELSPGLVLDFTGTDRSALLSLVSGAPVRASYGKSAGGLFRRMACTLTCETPVRELHTIDFHQALATAAGMPVVAVPDAGHLVLPSGVKRPDLPDGYVLIHPGTAREEKFWPAAHWAALVDDLHHKYRVPIVLTGGNWEFERQHLAGILSATTVPILDLSGKLNLRQLAPVIAGARLAVTVDTAAMHLASSFCVPQIALFGPTNPFHWAPRHQGATVLQSGVPEGTPWRPKQAGAPMSGLAWETVAAAAHRWLVQG
jgi:ADP-heptose:LPS heptosyltransferase